MDPLSSLALTAVAVEALANAVYGASRKSMCDGLKDDRERLRGEGRRDEITLTVTSTPASPVESQN